MRIDVNGTELYYEVQGSGQPLIMAHGNGETHKIFDKAIEILKNSFTVYAVDTRGHGESAAVSEYHYDDIAEDFYRFIEKLNIEKPVFYGFSDGGIVGLILASRYPQLFSRLIVSGANLRPDGIRGSWLWLFKAIYNKTKEPKMRMMLEEPDITAGELADITAPTTVLCGRRDMVKRAHSKEIAHGIANSEFRVIPWSGHGGYIVHSRRIAKIILECAGTSA